MCMQEERQEKIMRLHTKNSISFMFKSSLKSSLNRNEKNKTMVYPWLKF